MKRNALEIVGVVVALTMIYYWARLSRTWYPPRFSEENYSKIKIGTSAEEVVRLIGYPIYYCGYDWEYARPGGSILPIYHWEARGLAFSNGVVVKIIEGDCVL